MLRAHHRIRQIFYDATQYFSRDKTTLSMVIPVMDAIDSRLSDDTLNAAYSLSVRTAASLAKDTLNRYYNKTDKTEIYRIAMGMYSSSLYLR